MEQSKLVQNIIVRARNEALAMRAQSPQAEHIYLAILKVSTLTSEKIAPTSPERAAMDAEIAELNKTLEREQIAADSVGGLLRDWLKTKPFLKKQEAEEEVLTLFTRAGEQAKDKLKAADLLRAILSEPKEFIRLSNNGKKPDTQEIPLQPEDNDLFDAETAPGELPKEFPQRPQDSPDPNKDQGRGEIYAIPGANSQSDAGSERANQNPSGSPSHSNSEAKKRMVLPSFDPNEFSGPSLTIHNLGDGDGSISGVFDDAPQTKQDSGKKKDEPDDQPEPKPEAGKSAPEAEKPEMGAEAKPKGGGIDLGGIMEELRQRRLNGETQKPAEAETPEPTKSEPIKPAAEEPKPKREGVDLGAIMEEMRQKRLHGESGGQDGEPEQAHTEPPKKPADEPPKPAKVPPQKSEDGVDLGAIMQELRERRIHGEQNNGDSPSNPKPVNKPAVKPQPPEKTVPTITHQQPANTHEAKSAVSGEKNRTTEFLGKTYKGGVLSAVLKYLLRIVLYFAVLIGAGVLIAALSSFTGEQAVYLLWYLSAMIVLAVYYLLRIIPGLIERKFPPFAQSIRSLLSVAMVWCVTELFFETVFVSTGWVNTLKIITGIVSAIILLAGYGMIQSLPNTKGLEVDMKFWFRTLSGSPDKLSHEAFLISCIGAVIIERFIGCWSNR